MNNFCLEDGFPLIITPQHKNTNFAHFIESIQHNKNDIQNLLLKQGALLFRGFPVESAKQFSNVIQSLNLGNFVNYVGGDSPRTKVVDQVYTSTEAPPSFHIPLHQELSYIKNSPRHIYFFCEVEPEVGGSTIIADARKVIKHIDSSVQDKFNQKGLTYISRYYYKSQIMTWLNKLQRSHKSWPEVFETSNKFEVEAQCKQNEFEWLWLKNDWVQIKQKRPALTNHPLTNESVWFNQAHLFDFNPKLLGLKNYLGVKLFYMRKTMRLHEIEFGDGSRIPKSYLYHILDVLNENTVYFPWKKNDVLVLDNVLAMHGRAPFKGKRRILTALTS